MTMMSTCEEGIKVVNVFPNIRAGEYVSIKRTKGRNGNVIKAEDLTHFQQCLNHPDRKSVRKHLAINKMETQHTKTYGMQRKQSFLFHSSLL